MNFTAEQFQTAQTQWPAISEKTRVVRVPPPLPEWLPRPKPIPPNPDILFGKIEVTLHIFRGIRMGYCPEYDELIIADPLPETNNTTDEPKRIYA